MFGQTEDLYLSTLEREHAHAHYVSACAKNAIKSDKEIFFGRGNILPLVTPKPSQELGILCTNQSLLLKT